MEWLQKHWKGAAIGLAGVVGTTIAGKIADHYLDASIFTALGGLLHSSWMLMNTSLPVPAWLAIVVLLGTALLGFKLRDLKKGKGLNEHQRSVLQCVAWYYQQFRSEPAFHNLQNGTNLSPLELQVAIDELCKRELITWEIDMALSIEHQETITVASLTPKGRAYAMEAQRQAA